MRKSPAIERGFLLANSWELAAGDGTKGCNPRKEAMISLIFGTHSCHFRTNSSYLILA